MTKRTLMVIVSLVLMAVVLSGCKMPASKAPEESDNGKTTPILIETQSPPFQTQTAMAKDPGAATLGPGQTPDPTATLTPEPTEIIPVPTVTRPATYTVKEGEFPYCIARRFDLNPADLLALNNLGSNQLVSPGTTLKIPATGNWVGEGRVRNPHPTVHTVTAGETIYAIACFYGDVSPEAIIAVNRLQEPYALTSGQSLNIP